MLTLLYLLLLLFFTVAEADSPQILSNIWEITLEKEIIR